MWVYVCLSKYVHIYVCVDGKMDKWTVRWMEIDDRQICFSKVPLLQSQEQCCGEAGKRGSQRIKLFLQLLVTTRAILAQKKKYFMCSFKVFFSTDLRCLCSQRFSSHLALWCYFSFIFQLLAFALFSIFEDILKDTYWRAY